MRFLEIKIWLIKNKLTQTDLRIREKIMRETRNDEREVTNDFNDEGFTHSYSINMKNGKKIFESTFSHEATGANWNKCVTKCKEELAKEVRSEVIDVVSKNGGHLASNLGVVELTIALHSVFDLPKDNAPANTDNNPTVPEEYQFNLGEGLTISDDMRTRFTQVAKEAKLTQGQTDALMQMHSEMMLELINAGDKQAEEWAEECSKQGMLTPEKLGYANEALKVFGGDEVKNVLIQTGAANHPAVMRMLQTIGELIHEDTNKEGASKPPNNNDLSTILFPNSKY